MFTVLLMTHHESYQCSGSSISLQVKANLKEMQTKGIINENYKPLITLSSDSPNFSRIQDDVCITPQVDCNVISATMNPIIPTHISDPTIANPNIG